MKKIFFLVLLISCITLLISCKKEDDSNTDTSKIKTVTVNGVTTTYTYDSDGRCILKELSNGTKYTYEYSSNNIVVKYFAVGNPAGQIIQTYTLNSSGLAASDGTYNWTYDANGYVLTSSYSNISITSYNYSNGNLVSLTQQPLTSGDYVYGTHYYYSNLESRNYGLNFLGTINKNVVSSTSSQVANSTTTFNYTYQYDSEGRVIEQFQTWNQGSGTEVTSYTYY